MCMNCEPPPRFPESVFNDACQAALHVVAWFDIEEDYASQQKFGYQRNLSYLQKNGADPGSVWESQLTSYWTRGSTLDEGLRKLGGDTINARQYFAKHANAARALLATMIARTNDDNYGQATQNVRSALVARGQQLIEGGLPFAEADHFDTEAYWQEFLAPSLAAIRHALHQANPPTANELQRFASAIEPTTGFLLRSFDVTVSYVLADGALPQPGLPSGDIQPWEDNNPTDS